MKGRGITHNHLDMITNMDKLPYLKSIHFWPQVINATFYDAAKGTFRMGNWIMVNAFNDVTIER